MVTHDIPKTRSPRRSRKAAKQPRRRQAAKASDARLEPASPRHILVPIDFSSESKKALRYATRLAELLGASITLVHVVQTPEYVEGLPEFPHFNEPTAADEDLSGTTPSRAEQALEGFYDLLTERQIPAKTVVRRGKAYAEIVDAAKAERADLVIIATHGNGKMIGGHHLGSTSERVVRHAPCPVLVVREQEREFLPGV